jgi:tetratricopeptide (TPR) repeat protein
VQKNEIRLNYQQANQLVQVGRFDEALEILKEIDGIKPNTENILYLMAVCQAKAGRKAEALELCERLIQDFDHDNAKILIKTLESRVSPLGREKKKRESARKKEDPSSEPVAPSADQEEASAVAEQAEPEAEAVAADNPDSVPAKEKIEDVNQVAAETDVAVADENLPEKDVTVEKMDAAVVQDDTNGSIGPTRMRRPLWLVLLWSSMLALLVAYLLYINVVDPWLNPF